MVTAVDPGFDIVEDAVRRLPDQARHPGGVDRRRRGCSRATRTTTRCREYFALVSEEEATLDAQNRSELAESDAYAEISTRVEEFRDRVDETAARVTSFEGLFYELPGGN